MLLTTSFPLGIVRRSAVCLALVLGYSACALPLAAQAQDKLANRILPLIKAHQGKVSVAIKQLATGETFVYQADEPMPTASLIKLPVMVEAYRQAEAGKLDLAKMVTLREEDKVPGSGVLTVNFSPGTSLSARDCIRLMIAFSDNTATNLVLDQIGLPATNVLMEQLELPNTKIHAKVFRGKTSIAPQRSKQFGLGSTTAGEMLRLLEMLHAKKLVTPAACDEMLEHLRHCDDKNRIRRYLPSSMKVAHKTGSVNAVRTVAGIIEVPGAPIALCVLTSENKDQRWTDANAAEKLIADIAREAYQHFQAPAVAGKGDAPPEPTEQILRVGAQGELVQALQRTLNARSQPSPDLSTDGDFGAVTKEAVQAFQRAKNISASGDVGPETWQALGPLVWKDAPAPEPEAFNAQQLPRAPRESLDGPPLVTCKAWAIADGKTGELLWSDRADAELDFASTTKMMTAYIVAQLAKADAKVLDEEIVFSEAADKTPGSTSDLKAGERIRVRELLYGLMLPSGNDASIALAEHFGPRLAQGSGDSPQEAATPVEQFVAEMNRQAKALGMEQTHFANPHGLTAKGHHTTARDLLKLARAVLDDPLLAKYVATRQHGTRVVGQGGYVRNVAWKNTNQLLPIEGYLGVKTGTTDSAGACLVSGSERDGQRLIMVVLGSSSSAGRYVDSRNLYRWAWRERGKQ